MRAGARRVLRVAAGLLIIVGAFAGLQGGGPGAVVAHGAAARPRAGIHRIRHVVVIMQENRSFDSYFGTFPGADGLPARNGGFTVCVPVPRAGRCQRPYHDGGQVDGGAGHGQS
ncbi:MAG: hypothetical protein JWM71_1842, partial [Solirubrobacteraceae bacterium]|nr:hypothetical protein [Solirubrobacteraceae bacterium]